MSKLAVRNSDHPVLGDFTDGGALVLIALALLLGLGFWLGFGKALWIAGSTAAGVVVLALIVRHLDKAK